MTRKTFQLCVAVATAAIFSLATASVASAGIVFTAPTNNSYVQVSPTIEWTTQGTIAEAAACTLDFNNALAAATNPCNGSPYFATIDPTDPGNILWDLNIAALSTLDGVYELTVQANFTVGGPDTQTFTFTRDTVAPAVTIDPVATPTNDNTPTFTFSQTELNPGTLDCAFDVPNLPSNTVSGYAPCTSSTSATPSTPLADGGRALYVRSTDAAGNIGYAAMGVIIDTALPSITVASPQPNQVLQSSVPELSIAAADPDPGTGVSSLLCKYDAESFLPCNDTGFQAKSLPHGPHTLTVQATDGATNVATLVVPFSVNTSLDDLPNPTVPTGFKAKKLSGKVKGSKYILKIQGSFAVPAGFDPAVACKGTVRFSITGKLKGKKAKTFRKSTALKPSGQTCTYSANFSIPKAYKGKRLVTRTVFKGNALFGGFSKTAVIRKA